MKESVTQGKRVERVEQSGRDLRTVYERERGDVWKQKSEQERRMRPNGEEWGRVVKSGEHRVTTQRIYLQLFTYGRSVPTLVRIKRY